MCLPLARSIAPVDGTVSEWHAAQLAGSGFVEKACPAGGMSWQVVQPVSEPPQVSDAFLPSTVPYLKFPWQ